MGCPLATWTEESYHGNGAVSVVVPPESGTADLEEGAQSIILDPTKEGSAFSETMLAGFDLRGDGFQDLLISDYAWDNTEETNTDWGRIYLWDGGPVGF